MSVKKVGKSRKTKLAAARSRSGGSKAAKPELRAKTKKARGASMPRTGRSAAKAAAKRAGSAKAAGARRSAASVTRSAALARLKKAAAARAKSAKSRAKVAARLARAKQAAGRGKLVKPARNLAQPAARETAAQKVLSERRAHAEAVLALRATTAKPEKHQKKPEAASAPKPSAAPVRAPGLPSQPFQRPDMRFPGGIKPIVKPPGGAKPGFKPAEYIVYPAHGVGQILAIEEQEVAGFKLELFVISFAKDKMILKVPTPKTVSVGMRKLAGADVVKQALTTLTGRARIKRTMWSRRAQEYEAKINSGDLVAIAEVVRDLYRSEAQPEQSYSERQLYEAALDRVAREIAVVQKLTETESLKLIESQLQKGPRRTKAEEGEGDAAAGESEDGVDEAA